MDDLIGTMEDLAVDVNCIEDLNLSPNFLLISRQHRRSICMENMMMPIVKQVDTPTALTPKINFQPSTPTSNLGVSDLFSSPLLSSKSFISTTTMPSTSTTTTTTTTITLKQESPFLRPMIGANASLSIFNTRPEPIIAQPVFIGIPPSNTSFQTVTTPNLTTISQQTSSSSSSLLLTPSTPSAPPSTPAIEPISFQMQISNNNNNNNSFSSSSSSSRHLRPRRSSKQTRDGEFVFTTQIKKEDEQMLEENEIPPPIINYNPKDEGEEEWGQNTRYQPKNKHGPKQTAIRKKKRMSISQELEQPPQQQQTNEESAIIIPSPISPTIIHKRVRNVISPSSLETSEEEKQKRRLLANRLAAQASRDRKKARKRQLELEVEQLEESKQKTLQKMKNLKSETNALKGEFQSLLCAFICHTASQQQSQIGNLITAVGGRFIQNQIQQQQQQQQTQKQQQPTTPLCEV